MAWDEINKNAAIDLILDCIASGQSLKSIIDSRPRSEVPAYSTFMLWLDENKSLSEKYARAMEQRELFLLDEIFKIADDSEGDYDGGLVIEGVELKEPKFNAEHVQRSRLRVDVRKWALSKMNAKKYGDKVDVTSAGEKLPQTILKIGYGKTDDPGD